MNKKWYLEIAAVLLLMSGLTYAFAEDADEEENTPVMHEAFNVDPLAVGEKPNPWAAPNYVGQEKALGWSPTAFAVPPSMQERVNFWLDIYTKYSTDQGVLHDSLYTHIVYAPVDFTDIMQNMTLTTHQRERERKKRVDGMKAEIRERLHRIAKLPSSEGLEGEDLRYWKMFEKVDGDPKKFYEASEKGRLRFQLGQKDRIVQGIYQSGRYLDQMEQIFREEGLPIELTRLPFVESSFNLRARSKVGASGIWQFMRFTAKAYMKMNAAVDERNDPLKATRAAAKKLRGNYMMLESWPLAVTGYNHGPSGVARMVKKLNTNNLEEMLSTRGGRFGFASANFYASFLAALEAERNAKQYYGGKLFRMPELKGQEIVLDRSLPVAKLLEWFDGDVEKAKRYNPHVIDRAWKGRVQLLAKNFIRVPPEKVSLVQDGMKNHKVDPARSSSSTSDQTYMVESGDNLSAIARQFGVSTQALMDANDIADPRRVRSGQTLVIPK